MSSKAAHQGKPERANRPASEYVIRRLYIHNKMKNDYFKVTLDGEDVVDLPYERAIRFMTGKLKPEDLRHGH